MLQATDLFPLKLIGMVSLLQMQTESALFMLVVLNSYARTGQSKL